MRISNLDPQPDSGILDLAARKKTDYQQRTNKNSDPATNLSETFRVKINERFGWASYLEGSEIFREAQLIAIERISLTGVYGQEAWDPGIPSHGSGHPDARCFINFVCIAYIPYLDLFSFHTLVATRQSWVDGRDGGKTHLLRTFLWTFS